VLGFITSPADVKQGAAVLKLADAIQAKARAAKTGKSG
jgi:hypothetical protein